jgi:hypothetical protein
MDILDSALGLAKSVVELIKRFVPKMNRGPVVTPIPAPKPASKKK